MDDSEIRRRLADHEDGWTERKRQKVGDDKICNTLVSFANSLPENGFGILFIGVDDDGSIRGVNDTERMQQRVRRIAADQAYPPIHLSARVIEESGRHVVAVIVSPNFERPHFTGPAYIRIGSETVRASESQFSELIATRTGVARMILMAKNSGERIIVEDLRAPHTSHRTECIVSDCNPHFASFSGIHGGYSHPLVKITVSRIDSMGHLLFTLNA
jgi:predicted HTH transcriptional regulator